MVPRVIPEEQNFKNEMFELVLGFRELALNLIKLRDANDSISGRKESTNCPWCELAREMHEVSTLATPNQLLVTARSSVLLYVILSNLGGN